MLELLSRRLHDDLDAGLAALLGLQELQTCLPSGKELREHLGELRIRSVEGLLEPLP